MSRAKMPVFIFLCMVVFSSIFLDYWSYSRAFYAGYLRFDGIMAGTADAPPQYRILVPLVAIWLGKALHLGVRHAVALIDLVALCGAGGLLISLMRRTDFYRSGDQSVGFAGMLISIALAQYYLSWLNWYQTYDTLLGVLYASTLIWLFTTAARQEAAKGSALLALSVLASAIESWSRADLVVVLNGGFIISIILFRSQLTDFLRVRFFGACCAGAAAGAATQLYLSRALYPQATYGDTALVQFFTNLNAADLTVYLTFLLPTIFVLFVLLRRRSGMSADALLLSVPAGVYFLIVLVIGRIGEVRLFFPFVFPLIPATADAILQEALQLKPRPDN